MQAHIDHIQRTLAETAQLMGHNLDQLGSRGQSTQHLEQRADDLEQTSFLFVSRTVPWYRAAWWRTQRTMGWWARVVRNCAWGCCCSRQVEEPDVMRKKLLDV